MVGQAVGLQPIDHKEAKDGYGFLLKGVIVGPAGVGKTSLMNRFASDEFNPLYIKTIGVDFFVKSFLSAEGDYLKIQIWDTAGEERFRTITNSYYRGSHGMLMVFDVCDESSFHEISSYVNEAEMYTQEGTPMILVGNKTDCERKVSRQIAEDFAKENGMMYVESSAKDNENVFQTFEVFIEEMLKKQRNRRSNVKAKPMVKGLDKNKANNSVELHSTVKINSGTCTII